MIVKKSDRFVVMDTTTKVVISEHTFEDSKKSILEADAAARAANSVWKASKKTNEDQL